MANADYKVNEDGSVTKISRNNSNNNYNNNSGGSSDNSGCGWIIGIAVVIGIIIGISKSNDTSINEVSLVDSVEVVEEAPVVVETTSASYLNVSDNNIVFDSDGGSQEITISTDGDWEISTNVADWAQLTKYSNYVILQVPRNTSRSSRSDYFEIRADNYTRRVNFSQNGDDSPYAQINSIWVDHNEFSNGQKGMMIHIDFEANGLLNHTLNPVAYFEFSNGTALDDYDGNYRTTDGHVSVGDTGVSNYEGCQWKDFKLFMPYEQLHMSSGSYSLQFFVNIFDKSDGNKCLVRSKKYSFTFTK